MLSGQVLIKILAFVFNVYVVRRLGDVHFGRYSAVLAYVAIFGGLTDLGMSPFSVREMARQKERIRWMVPNVMALRGLLSLPVIAGIILSARLLDKTPDMMLGVFVASCGLLVYAFQGPLDSVMVARERLDFSSLFKLSHQVVFMVLGTILLLVGAGYVGLLLASLGGTLAMGLASGYVVRQIWRLRFEFPDPRRWWPLLRASSPFGIFMVLNVLTRQFNTVFMSAVLTDAAVGWYNVPYHLILMMLLLAQSLAVSMYPTLIREYDSGRRSIRDTVRRALRYLLLLSLPMAVGGTLLAKRIIILLYGQEFAPAIPAMRILVWALPSMFLAEILGRTVAVMHREKKAVKFVVARVLLNIALSVALIPRFGIVGGAVAAVVTGLIQIVLFTVIIGPTMLWERDTKPLLRVAAAATLVGVVVWLLRDMPFLASLDDRIALSLMLAIGAAVYAGAALLFGAITRGEALYLYGVARRRVRGWGRAK